MGGACGMYEDIQGSDTNPDDKRSRERPCRGLAYNIKVDIKERGEGADWIMI
jgi:hypothetical protein